VLQVRYGKKKPVKIILGENESLSAVDEEKLTIIDNITYIKRFIFGMDLK